MVSVPPVLASLTREYTFEDAVCADHFPNGPINGTEDDWQDTTGTMGNTHTPPNRINFDRPTDPTTRSLPQAALCYQEDTTQLLQALSSTVIPTHDVTDAEARQSPQWRAAHLEALNALRIMNALGPPSDLPEGKRA